MLILDAYVLVLFLCDILMRMRKRKKFYKLKRNLQNIRDRLQSISEEDEEEGSSFLLRGEKKMRSAQVR